MKNLDSMGDFATGVKEELGAVSEEQLDDIEKNVIPEMREEFVAEYGETFLDHPKMKEVLAKFENKCPQEFAELKNNA
jgi:hypothetical protein